MQRFFMNPMQRSNIWDNCRSLIQSFPTDASWITAELNTALLESVLEYAPMCTLRSAFEFYGDRGARF
jgi:hypothetical protein